MNPTQQSLGFPVIGDRKYGSKRRFADGIALHARRLVLTHPVRQTPLEITAPLPAAWRTLNIPRAALAQLEE